MNFKMMYNGETQFLNTTQLRRFLLKHAVRPVRALASFDSMTSGEMFRDNILCQTEGVKKGAIIAVWTRYTFYVTIDGKHAVTIKDCSFAELVRHTIDNVPEPYRGLVASQLVEGFEQVTVSDGNLLVTIDTEY